MRRPARCLLPTLILAVFPVSGAVAPVAAAAPAAPLPLSVWVWSPQPPGELRDFASSHHVVEVFLATPASPTPVEVRQIRRTVRLLHGDGVLVSALGGEPAWVRRHDHALGWARAAVDTANFDGLHLDVEPHQMRAWHGDHESRARLIRRYLCLLHDIRPLSGRVVVDVQFAYGTISVPRAESFADAILRRVDGVTVMSYRDTARGNNSLLAISRDWLTRAGRADVPLRLAVETNPSTEGEHVTFAEEGRRALRRVIRTVDDRLCGTRSYTGFAVHDLDGWRSLGR